MKLQKKIKKSYELFNYKKKKKYIIIYKVTK